MIPPECDARHRCADGGEGGCSQPAGHYGRHMCGSCLAFFSGGEAIRSAKTEPGSRQTGASTMPARGDSGYFCAHCSPPAREAVSGKRCRHCKNLLCEICREETCPYICGTCAHCGQPFTAQTQKGSCDYCYNLICTECGRPCPHPRDICYHCKRPIGRSQSNEICDKCGYLIHSDHRLQCPEGYRRA